jgi:hypothetical protein
MSDTKTLYRVTSLADRSVKLHNVLSRASRDQTVRIDQWFMWGQAFLSDDTDLARYTKFIQCDAALGYDVQHQISSGFQWEGPDWNEKAQHRIQKDIAKGGVQRIITMQRSWTLVETQIWINAPFRVDIVDFLNTNIVVKSDIPYKGQIRS